MLLQISFFTIRHREKEEALAAIEYVFFVRLCCLGASICLFASNYLLVFFFFLFHLYNEMVKNERKHKKKTCVFMCMVHSLMAMHNHLSLSLCLVFLFFTLVTSSTTASSPKAFVDPMCLSLPSLKPLRHVGLIDVCVCVCVSNADANIERKS